MPKPKIKIQRDAVLPRVDLPERESAFFFIAVEGAKTEKQYFEDFGDKRIKIKVLSTLDGYSKPIDVLNRMKTYINSTDFKEKYDIGEGDQFWMVFDVDHWKNDEILTLIKEAEQAKIQVAISNPCFEFWRFLHKFDEDEIDQSIHQVPIVKRSGRMKEILSGTNFNYNQTQQHEFREDVKRAIHRAEKKESGRTSLFPAFPGTDVYLLVKSLPIKS